ncbi:MAG: Fic family protein [Planctomycetales bacterium]|nr:Fic family protein [Planctomycetales bacterium]
MLSPVTPRQRAILDIIAGNHPLAISAIHGHLTPHVSIPTVNRDVAALVAFGYVTKNGSGRATVYTLSRRYTLFAPIDVEAYFAAEPDQRSAMKGFNHDLLEILKREAIFTEDERRHLNSLRQEYRHNLALLSPALYQKELERLTIELSWKSSQIEGNTYSLLETERLFVEQQAAKGKSPGETTMILNHKACLDFILEHNEIGQTLNLATLEQIHSLLISDLGVSRNLRSRTVGITGTTYQPLDNPHQIKEATELMCDIVNNRPCNFEKALLAVCLISYIQPFEDGNKRTDRMVSNALLIADGACPLSYRSVDSLDYKKAMLLFYEQNNLAAFKQIFMQQIEFAVKTYFR